MEIQWDEEELPDHPPGELNKSLHNMMKDDFLTDFTIRIENKRFRVHRVVVAAVSSYFEALFRAEMVERTREEVTLMGVSPLAVSNIIDFAYTNKIPYPKDSPEELLRCAMYLQVPGVINMASKELKNQINTTNCLSMLQTFEGYALQPFAKHLKNYISHNTSEILKAQNINQIEYDPFSVIVEFWGNSQWDLFVTIKEWVTADTDNRRNRLKELLCYVRFGLMTATELKYIKKMDIYNWPGEEWHELYNKAVDYHKLPTRLQIINSSGQNKSPTEPMPVCLDLQADVGSHVLDANKKWKKLYNKRSPIRAYPLAAVEMNNFLIVHEGYKGENEDWHIFNPRDLTWSKLANMNHYRRCFALAHDGRYLYAIAGVIGFRFSFEIALDVGEDPHVTDTVCKYDFEANTWTDLTTRVPIGCYRHSMCMLPGAIYITGGFQTILEDDLYVTESFDIFPDDREQLSGVHCYDPSADTWTTIAPMPLRQRQCSTMKAITFKGEHYVTVISRTFVMQFYNPRIEQWTVWTSFSSLNSRIKGWTHDGKVLARNNTLFLISYKGADRAPAFRGGWFYDDDDDDDYDEDAEAFNLLFLGGAFDEPLANYGECVAWKVDPVDGNVKEIGLNNYPLCREDEEGFELVQSLELLSLSPKSTKNLRGDDSGAGAACAAAGRRGVGPGGRGQPRSRGQGGRANRGNRGGWGSTGGRRSGRGGRGGCGSGRGGPRGRGGGRGQNGRGQGWNNNNNNPFNNDNAGGMYGAFYFDWDDLLY